MPASSRSAASTSKSGQPCRKRVRGTKGKSSLSIAMKASGSRRRNLGVRILELPAELFCIAISFLAPKDLLALSSINKEWHRALINHDMRFLWKRKLEEYNVPALPACMRMSDMSYFNLLFNVYCQCCGRRNNASTDFYLMKRACVACRDIHCIEEMQYRRRPGKDETVLSLIPGTKSMSLGNHGRCFWYTEILIVEQQYAALKDRVRMKKPGAQLELERFEAERSALVQEASVLGRKLSAWYIRYDQLQQDEAFIIKQRRVHELQDRFCEIHENKFEAEDILGAVNMITPDIRGGYSPLTEKEWVAYRSKLEPLIQRVNVKRHSGSSEFEDRNSQLQEAFRRWKSPFSSRIRVVPQSHPQYEFIASHRDIRALRFSSRNVIATKQGQGLLLKAFATAVKEYHAFKWQALRERLPDSLPRDNDTDPLQLATSTFVLPRGRFEPCEPRFHDSFVFVGRMMLAVCNLTESGHARLALPSFSRWLSKVSASLVTFSNLNPRSATWMDMDEVNALFICQPCVCSAFAQNELQPSDHTTPIYTWRAALFHANCAHQVLQDSRFAPFSWFAPGQDDRERNAAMTALSERISRRRQELRAASRCRWWCSDCADLEGDGGLEYRQLLQHLREKHSIREPNEGHDYSLNECDRYRFEEPFLLNLPVQAVRWLLSKSSS